MKILFCCLSFFFGLTSNVYSQPKNVTNAQERQLIKEAVGLWQGVNGNDTFIVYLKASASYDTLVGWHEFKINGIVESSSMVNKGNYDSLSVLYIVSQTKKISGESLKLAFSDPNRSKNLFLVNFVVSSDKAKWAIISNDLSEGQYGTTHAGSPRIIPPASEIMKVKEWTMTKLQ